MQLHSTHGQVSRLNREAPPGRQKSRRGGFFSFHDLWQHIPQKVEKSKSSSSFRRSRLPLQDCVAGCHARTSGRRPAKKKSHDAMFFVKLVQPHAGQGAGVGGEQVDTRGARTAGGHHHSLAQPKLHLPGSKVCDHHDEPADE